MQWFFVFFLLFICDLALAGHSVTYTGEAKSNGKTIYTEHHLVEYDENNKLLSATTTYKGEDGSLLAKIVSDFKSSLTVPNHTVENFRTGNIQGLRWEGDKIVLFDHDKNQPEKTKVLETNSDKRILVGCQGLNYYLLDNIETTKGDKELPLRFLIPGKLDYYDFTLRYKRESNGIVEYEVSIDSWFLSLFAPKLYVNYDKNQKHIVWYKGLSNITDEKGSIQNVEIKYDYAAKGKDKG